MKYLLAEKLPYNLIVQWSNENDMEVKAMYNLYSEFSSLMTMAEMNVLNLYKRGQAKILPKEITN